VEARHLNIEKYDLRPPCTVFGERIHTVCGSPDFVAVRLEKEHVSCQQIGLAVDEQSRSGMAVDIRFLRIATYL